MDIVSLPAEEDAVRRFVTALWLPYRRELADGGFGPPLADDLDVVEAETDYRLEMLTSEDHAVWVALADGTSSSPEAPGLAIQETGAGFVTATVEASPPVFARPDRLVVGDVYVREDYRGTELAADLFDRVRTGARERGCPELALDVDASNERAIAFYEGFGFQTSRKRMTCPVDPP